MNDATQFFNTTAGGGYEIERSLRFNSSDSAYLSRTPASAGNRKTYTLSFWVKRAKLGGSYQVIISNTDSSAINGLYCDFTADYFQFAEYGSSNFIWNLQTAAVYRDTSAWYHFVCAVDTTQATSSDRVKIWVNGSRVTAFYPGIETYPTLNYDTNFNTTALTAIGRFGSYPTQYYFDGYLADIHLIDGQALDPTSFGQFDTNGVWQPKAYSGTYGTNGFHLDFSDNSAATAGALGADSSGNGNNWTPNNLSVTAGAGNDSFVDVPTNGTETDTGVGGEVRGNYATLNPLDTSGTAPVNGNLDFTTTNAQYIRATMAMNVKTYFEVTVNTAGTGGLIGIRTLGDAIGTQTAGDSYAYHSSGSYFVDGANSGSWGSSYGAGYVIGIAYNPDDNEITAYINGTSQGTKTGLDSGKTFAPWIHAHTCSYSVNFGQRPFAYPLSGFKALCTANLPAPTIEDGSTAMDVKLYTGNASTNTISGLGFSPDLVWIKARSTTDWHNLIDAVRGNDKILYSNSTVVESSEASASLTSFNSDGFTLSGSGSSGVSNTNGSGITYAAWCWDAGSSTVTNNDGSITSQVRANPGAGFSIVTYTGNGTNNATVGHGLGVDPGMVIVKSRSGAYEWPVYHKGLAPGYVLFLNLNNLANLVTTPGAGGIGGASSTTFTCTQGSLNINNTNTLGETYVAYCFAPVEGYSAFGYFFGNGVADGPFVYTGFRPRWILLKNVNVSSSWALHDTARATYNVVGPYLLPDSSAAEASVDQIDFLSNGFKLRNSGFNTGEAWVYTAFAEHPFNHSRAR